MRAVPSLLALLLIGAFSLVPSSASADQGRSGSELLKAAEQSFSDIPFGTKEPPPGLTLIDDGGCINGRGECSYMDANQVGHYFLGSEDGLVVKWVDLAQAGDRPIAALGIGKARVLDGVVEQVRRFLPEAEIDCHEYPRANKTTYTCGATLGDGWFSLFFDSSRRLNEVRIDAYHFT